LHVYLGNQEACVVNRDGTPSHGGSIDLPRHVRRGIAKLGLVTIEEQVERPLEVTLSSMGQGDLADLIMEAEQVRFRMHI